MLVGLETSKEVYFVGNKKTRNRTRPNDRKYERVCVFCGKSYISAKPDGKYCSYECLRSYARKCYRENKVTRQYQKTCPICGTAFQTLLPHKKYCCKDCAQIGAVESQRKYKEKAAAILAEQIRERIERKRLILHDRCKSCQFYNRELYLCDYRDITGKIRGKIVVKNGRKTIEVADECEEYRERVTENE